MGFCEEPLTVGARLLLMALAEAQCNEPFMTVPTHYPCLPEPMCPPQPGGEKANYKL